MRARTAILILTVTGFLSLPAYAQKSQRSMSVSEIKACATLSSDIARDEAVISELDGEIIEATAKANALGDEALELDYQLEEAKGHRKRKLARKLEAQHAEKRAEFETARAKAYALEDQRNTLALSHSRKGARFNSECVGGSITARAAGICKVDQYRYSPFCAQIRQSLGG